MRKSARKFHPIALRFQGNDLFFLGEDIVTGWWLSGFPDDMPLTPCWERHGQRRRRELVNQQEAWQAAVLTRGVRVLIDSRWVPMTPELVQRLGGTADGTASEDLLYGYLSGLGWIQRDHPKYQECDLPTPVDAVLAPTPFNPEERRALTHLPGPNTLCILREIARRCSTAAHRVWRSWPISDFIWTKLEIEQEQKAERDKARKSPTAGLTPEMAAIGVSNA